MAIQIQLRRGSRLQWNSANPILAEGELTLEIDTHRFKIGDGISTWGELPYASGPPGIAGPPGPEGTINRLIDIQDVDYSNIEDGAILVYDGPSDTWKTTLTMTSTNLDGGHF